MIDDSVKVIKRNYIYNLIYQILVMIVPLLTTPYISRVLDADGIGVYSFTSSIVTYFLLVGNFGMATYGQLRISVTRKSKYSMSCEFWGIFCARLIMLSNCGILYFIFMVMQKEYQTMYLILLIQFFATAIDIGWLFQGLEEFKKLLIRNLIIKFVSVILIFLLVNRREDLYIYVIILQGSILLGNLSVCIYLKRYLVPISYKEIRILPHISASFKYFIPTIATSIYTLLDKSMIGWITHSEFENGYYEQAHRIEQLITSVVTSLSVVTLPRMALWFKEKHFDKITDQLYRSVRFTLWISIALSTGLFAISSNLVPLFLGSGFEPCIGLLRIFSILIIVVGLNNVFGKQILVAGGMQKAYNQVVICGALVNFICNFILIQLFGSKGAAISSVIAESVILLGFIKFSHNYMSLHSLIKYSFPYVLAGIVMCLFILKSCTFFKPCVSSIIIQVLTGAFIYTCLLLILKDKMTVQLFQRIRYNKLRKKK